MLFHQIQRVKKNILPFACIGLFLGIVIGKASWFRSFAWINDFLVYANISTRYPDSGQVLFFRHFDTGLLTYLLITIFLFSGLSRIILGRREKGPEHPGVIRTLEGFGSLLAIAWLGLILGIGLPTLIYQGFGSFVSFVLNAVHPLLFLVEVGLCTRFLSSRALSKVQGLMGRSAAPRVGTRLEGVVVLALGILMVTFQDRYLSAIASLTSSINSLLS